MGLLIGNLVWLLTDQILPMGLGLLVGVWVAQLFEAHHNLACSITLRWPGVAVCFAATMGLDTLVVGDIARHPECQEENLGTAFILQMAGGIITLLLAVTAISLLYPQDSLTLWLVGIVAAGTMFQSFETINFWFQSQVQSKIPLLLKTPYLYWLQEFTSD